MFTKDPSYKGLIDAIHYEYDNEAMLYLADLYEDNDLIDQSQCIKQLREMGKFPAKAWGQWWVAEGHIWRFELPFYKRIEMPESTLNKEQFKCSEDLEYLLGKIWKAL
jgi:hypothetical protein